MKKILFDQKFFKFIERAEVKRLRSLSVNESIAIMEQLLESGILQQFRRLQDEMNKNR